MKSTKNSINPDDAVVKCNNCGMSIKKVKLVGFSLICPLCGRPQNGRSHPKTKWKIQAIQAHDLKLYLFCKKLV